MQNYWNLYLACKQQQPYWPVNYRGFRKKRPIPLPLAASLLARDRAFARDSLRSPKLDSLLAGKFDCCMQCSIIVNGLSVWFPNVGLCSIGKILGWVQLSSITEPNRSQSNDLSSIGFDYGTFDKLTTPGNVWLHGDSLERPNWYLLRKIKLLHALHNLL